MKDIAQRVLDFLRGGGETIDLSDERLIEALARLERFAEIGRMAAGFAHDMRTPLHVASSAAESIAVAHPEDRENAELIRRNCAHALGSLKALLEFSKTGGGAFAEESLDAVAARAVALIERPCADKKVKLRVRWGRPPGIRADGQRLVGVVYNLLTNALEATPGGGKLSVNTGRAKGSVWLTVKDTGEGMAPETAGMVATPFFTTKRSGTGLGLYLAKRIVAEHGAQMTFQSKKGAGTTVKLVFPKA